MVRHPLDIRKPNRTYWDYDERKTYAEYLKDVLKQGSTVRIAWLDGTYAGINQGMIGTIEQMNDNRVYVSIYGTRYEPDREYTASLYWHEIEPWQIESPYEQALRKMIQEE